MTRLIPSIGLAALAAGCLCGGVVSRAEAGYRVEQVTDVGGGVFYPAINNLGDIAYARVIGEFFQVFLLAPDGALTQVTEGDFHHRFPQINDHGEIVWNREITLVPEFRLNETNVRGVVFDDGTTQERADINNDGEIIWHQSTFLEPDDPKPTGQTHSTIANGGVVIPAHSLGDGPNESSAISNSGEIVYRGVAEDEVLVGLDDELKRFTDSGLYSTTRGTLLEEVDEHVYVSVNTAGTVVWYGFDDQRVSQVYCLHDGVAVQITTGPRENRWSDLNDHGEIVINATDLNGARQIIKLTPTEGVGCVEDGTLPIDPMLVLHPEIRDSDEDGVPDVLDAFPEDPESFADTDGDGVADPEDPDRPVITAFVARRGAFNHTVNEGDLSDPQSPGQRGLLGTRLQIPAGSMPEPAVITARVGEFSPGDRVPGLAGNAVALGYSLAFGPEGTRVGAGTTLTLPYDVARLSEVLFGTVQAVRIDGDGTTTVLPLVQPQSFGSATVNPFHFSQFVVVGQTLSAGSSGGCAAAPHPTGANRLGSTLLLLSPLLTVAVARRWVVSKGL
jgi:hypothetical protein